MLFPKSNSRLRTHRPRSARPRLHRKIRQRGVTMIVGVLVSIWVMMTSPIVLGNSHYEAPPSQPASMSRPWGISPKYTKQEEHCLTQAIYYEAGNQSLMGKEAVALVILNRIRHKQYPSTVCGVVHQSTMVGEKRICQFSYHCFHHYRPNPELWAESQAVARKNLKNLFDRNILILLGQSQYFHAVYVRPKWAAEKQRVATIGDHVFYRDREL